MSAEWLGWVRRLQAIVQSDLTYAKDPYDVERYEQVRSIAAEVAASHSEATAERTDALFSEEFGYATPKLDIRAVVLNGEGAVLLVREKEDGLWTLPGGWVDVGESPSEVAEREVKEESGYEVRAVGRRSLGARNGNRRGGLLSQGRAAGALPGTRHPATDRKARRARHRRRATAFD